MFKILLGAALALCVQASTIDEVLKQLEAVKSFSGVSISPNGHWLTWVRAMPDGNSEIYLLDRKNPAAQPQRITAGDPAFGRREHNVVWSPDSKQFAFLLGADKIFLADASSRKVHQLADLKGYATDVRWRPDGSQIAFLYAANGAGGEQSPRIALHPRTQQMRNHEADKPDGSCDGNRRAYRERGTGDDPQADTLGAESKAAGRILSQA